MIKLVLSMEVQGPHSTIVVCLTPEWKYIPVFQDSLF